MSKPDACPNHVSPRTILLIVIPFVAIGLAVLSIEAFFPQVFHPGNDEPIPLAFGTTPAGTVSVGRPSDRPLDVGEEAGEMGAGGWLNGTPPSYSAEGTKLTVVDIWAAWCPFCRATAPSLVATHRKFENRGVKFVSLTSMPRESAEGFTKEFGIPWPSGYLATAPTLARYGVVNPGMNVGGYDVRPTLYLVGPDGRVRWCDQNARARHRDASEIQRDLEAAIERALAEGR
jgi:thiol-disulfide isomerase/thioredoxin